MRTVKGQRTGGIASVMMGLALLAAGTAQAQTDEDRFTTERPGSILIFPKVVWQENRNTVIQITNTSNMLAQAHCFYINGADFNGVPLWQITDFSINLTRQQPTHWSVCDGRPVNPNDNLATGEPGLDPGNVPPVAPGFIGGLVCVQVNVDEGASDANALKGEATIGDRDDLDVLVAVSKYNAVAIRGIDDDGDNVLRLDNDEYAACPAGAHLNFIPEGLPDDIINQLGNGPSAVSTTLALLPCNMDFENLVPGTTQLSLQFRDEMEGGVSFTPVDVNCWRAFNLGEAAGSLPQTPFGYARLDVTDGTTVGFVGVANVRRVGANGAVSTAANNLHFLGNEVPGFCAIDMDSCTGTADCADGATVTGDICVRNLVGSQIVLPESLPR
jgi:hypothetical protein